LYRKSAALLGSASTCPIRSLRKSTPRTVITCGASTTKLWASKNGRAVMLASVNSRAIPIRRASTTTAPDGQKFVVPRILDPRTNLRTTLTKIVERAGFEPWPRLFQNLRASCATDWVQRYPNHDVARWLGHSPLIAATRCKPH